METAGRGNSIVVNSKGEAKTIATPCTAYNLFRTVSKVNEFINSMNVHRAPFKLTGCLQKEILSQ